MSTSRRAPTIVVAVLALLATIAPAFAQTRAGIAIVNVAGVQGRVGDATVTASSNPAGFLVAERLDVSLARGDRDAAATSDGAAARSALLANRGNGSEAFALSASVPAGLAIRGIAIDGDGDGAFDPAHDTLLTDGLTPALDPGATLALLVLVSGTADGPDAGVVTLVARARTGSGAPGTSFAGTGDGGSDAVVGPTGAEARVAIPLDPVATAAAPVLVKSQSVRAPDGGAQPVRGAVVTYTLEARFADARRAARIDDPVPAGTRYVAGSLSLDDVPLTDAADDDPGTFDGTAIAVLLGDVPAPAAGDPVVRTVRFQAVLQ